MKLQARFADLPAVPAGLLVATLIVVSAMYTMQQAQAQSRKTNAQQLVETLLMKHPEVEGLELAAAPPNGGKCSTIAATNPKDIGEKCDADEDQVMRTQKPFVEKEADGFDVTTPLHDAAGKLIGTLGIDVKAKPGLTQDDALKIADKLLKEVEPQIPSQAFLFEPAR
jgi:hypothetical protein